MASISTTRTAIAGAITAMPLRCYDYAPSELPTPCAVVGFPSRYNPNDTLSDTASFTIPVSVYVPYSSNRAAEDNLESYLATSGSTSLIATIEALGGNYQVSAVRDFGVLENTNGQPIALGCVIDVDVYV
jgi:hypothetical protein